MVRITNDLGEVLIYIFDTMKDKELQKYVKKLFKKSFKKHSDFYSVIPTSHLDILHDLVKQRLDESYIELVNTMIYRSLEQK
jgi:hypothetical protein